MLDRYLRRTASGDAPAAGGRAATKPDADGTLPWRRCISRRWTSPACASRFASEGQRGAPRADAGADRRRQRFNGETTLDERGAVALVSMDEHLSGVDMSRLLAQGALKGRVSGHGNVNLKATARGMDADSLFMQTLNGHFDANLADGALEGVDLGYVLAQAQALVKHTDAPARSNPARTRFDAFKMSAEITNGMAKTKDIVISSPALRVTGQGNVSLPTKALDLALLATVLKAPGASAADIPLKITGTYVDPTVRPDAEALAKGAIKQKRAGRAARRTAWKDCWANDGGWRTRRTVHGAIARLVRDPRAAQSALAAESHAVPGVGVGGHAAADASGHGDPVLRALHGALSRRAIARRGAVG